MVDECAMNLDPDFAVETNWRTQGGGGAGKRPPPRALYKSSHMC